MTETQFVAALKVVEAERAELHERLELLTLRVAQLAGICSSLGGTLSVETEGELNPGGPSNPRGNARLIDARGAHILGHAIPWSVADGLRRLFHSVRELHRASGPS